MLARHFVAVLRDAPISANLSRFVSSRRQPEIGAGARRTFESAASSKADATESAVIGPTPGALMNRRAVECDFADVMTRRSRSLILSSNAVLAFAREMITSRITGDASSSPVMISSTRREKPPTDFPNKTPKVRRRPRISFSILTRERTRTSRAASKDRSSYPERDLIVTCLNQPVHTICASPAASFRSVLLGRTFNAALACRASMQIIGSPFS